MIRMMMGEGEWGEEDCVLRREMEGDVSDKNTLQLTVTFINR